MNGPKAAPGSLDDVARAARASIVSIESSIGAGSGYCALANGVVVTSQRVVGYERDILITTDQGTVARAVVLRVNVALDIALCVAEEPLKLPKVQLGSSPPKLGDPVLVLGRVGAEPVALATTVAAAERAFDGIGYIQTQAVPDGELCGAALLDASGRLVGSLVRPKKLRDGVWARNLVLPLAAFEGGLLSVDGQLGSLAGVLPEYGCPRCDTVFEPGLDRCLECGILLPHPWSDASAGSGDGAGAGDVLAATAGKIANAPERQAHHAASVALRALGIAANRARIGALTWRFTPGSENALIDLTVDDAGESLVLRSEVSKMPDGSFEHFYRHLLAQNASMSGPFRLGIRDMTVVMTAFEPVASISAETFPKRVDAFLAELARCQEAFKRFFGAEPATIDDSR